jgi:hypothetical protein
MPNASVYVPQAILSRSLYPSRYSTLKCLCNLRLRINNNDRPSQHACCVMQAWRRMTRIVRRLATHAFSRAVDGTSRCKQICDCNWRNVETMPSTLLQSSALNRVVVIFVRVPCRDIARTSHQPQLASKPTLGAKRNSSAGKELLKTNSSRCSTIEAGFKR